MDKRFSEMTFPEQLTAYESAMAEVSHLKKRLEEREHRLQIDPGGSDKIDELAAAADFLRHRAETAEKQIEEWKGASGLECGGDPDGVTPAKAKEFWAGEAKRIEAFQAQDIERQTDITALRHDIEVAEHERDEARKELEEWRRAHSQPIANPPEATGEYVDVMGEMTIPFTVQLPVELCREPIACDDPAIEAALQAVSGYVCTYIWGEDKKPAVVYCDVGDQNVEIESDDRTCLEKGSTRLTDEAVNSGSCNDDELGQKCDQS